MCKSTSNHRSGHQASWGGTSWRLISNSSPLNYRFKSLLSDPHIKRPHTSQLTQRCLEAQNYLARPLYYKSATSVCLSVNVSVSISHLRNRPLKLVLPNLTFVYFLYWKCATELWNTIQYFTIKWKYFKLPCSQRITAGVGGRGSSQILKIFN